MFKKIQENKLPEDRFHAQLQSPGLNDGLEVPDAANE